MKEDFLHFIWAHRLWPSCVLRLADGRPVEILDPGVYNTGAGPDFFNAKIRLDGDTIAGNVEIHIRASDWHRHGHHTDMAYDSVILHVVNIHDREVARTNGTEIPALVLTVNEAMSERYANITARACAELPCARFARDMPQIYLTDWFTSLAHERIYAKSEHASELYRTTHKDWGAVTFILLARALGFSTNSAPMEQMALATPFHYLRRHSDSQEMLEAFIFGQAGLSHPQLPDDTPEGAYFSRLRQNYTFLSAKYNLKAPTALNWKFSGSRPQSSPWRRLALLAKMAAGEFSIASSFPHITTLDEARSLFDVPLTGFWSTHYSPTSTTESPRMVLGESAVDSLVINVIIPLLYAYGVETYNDSARSRAVELLQQLPPEDNALTRVFTTEGIECDDAFTSQAMIQLRRNYCQPRKCLYCRIGHRYLRTM